MWLVHIKAQTQNWHFKCQFCVCAFMWTSKLNHVEMLPRNNWRHWKSVSSSSFLIVIIRVKLWRLKRSLSVSVDQSWTLFNVQCLNESQLDVAHYVMKPRCWMSILRPTLGSVPVRSRKASSADLIFSTATASDCQTPSGQIQISLRKG